MSNDKTKFEHKGVSITIKDNGLFSATVDLTEHTATSLTSLKKKLDKLKPFESFEGFIIYHDGDTRHHRVVGLRKDRGYNRYNWLTADGYTLHTVYPSTKENMALVKKIAALQAAKEKAEKDFNEKIGLLQDQLVQAKLPEGDES